jgi:hypothetical protein
MKIQAAAFFCALLSTLPLFARDKSDVIVMNNGDRMTGEIKGLDDGVLYVSFDYIKDTAAVDWSKVHHLESNQLFIVGAVDGSVYTGIIKTVDSAAGRPIKIVPAETPEEQVAVERPEVITVTQTSTNFWERFNGNITTGVTYSKGNQSRQYNLGATVDYPRERWGAKGTVNSTLNTASGTSTATRNTLDLRALHLLPWNNWFYVGLGNFLQSSIQQIQLQSNLGGGIGRFLKNTNHSTILVAGGLGLQNVKYSQSQPAQNVLAGTAVTEMKFFRFNRTNLTIDAAAYPALTQPGRVYVNTSVSYYVKLFGKIDWNASLYGNWDNQPPPHFSGSDYGTTSGLSYSFGNK